MDKNTKFQFNHMRHLEEERQTFNGIVRQKMKIQSLSTHPHADGRSGKFFSPQDTAGVSQEKGVVVPNNFSEW